MSRGSKGTHVRSPATDSVISDSACSSRKSAPTNWRSCGPLKEMIRYEPIPKVAPASLSVPFSIFDPQASQAAEKAKRLVFHCVGDTGGIHGVATQDAIANAMEEQLTTAPDAAKPAFFYHLGDVVYFNGQSTLYNTEFYEPYQYYRALIFAIPGNHDGDTQIQRGIRQIQNHLYLASCRIFVIQRPTTSVHTACP